MKCKACHKDTRYEPYMPIYAIYNRHNVFIGNFHPDCHIETLFEAGEFTPKKVEEMYKQMGFSRETNV